jgi:hypothetical protein
MPNPPSPPGPVAPSYTQAREQAFAAARNTLTAFQQSQRMAQPHRAMRHVALRPVLWLHMAVLPLFLVAGLHGAKAQVYGFWRAYLLWWSEWLDLPLHPATVLERADQLTLAWRTDLLDSGLSVEQGMWVGAGLTVLAWLATLSMRGHWLPVKYLVRTVCVVQALALAYFLWVPMPFPHGVLNHAMNMLDAGYTLMLAIPVLLGLGYYALNLSLATKLLHTLLIWAFFLVLVPQQALVHLVVLQHLSVVFMPVLYLCFGALFDMMVFVALYAWIASKAPLSATT